jgi:hypothetical protein
MFRCRRGIDLPVQSAAVLSFDRYSMLIRKLAGLFRWIDPEILVIFVQADTNRAV